MTPALADVILVALILFIAACVGGCLWALWQFLKGVGR